MKVSIQSLSLFLLSFLCFSCSSYGNNSYDNKIFIVDNSGSMGCGDNSGFESSFQGDRCKPDENYKVNLAQEQVVRQIEKLKGKNTSVAIIQMGGITQEGDKECKAKLLQDLTDDLGLVQQRLESNNPKIIVPNHSGSTATGKAIEEAWKIIENKAGRHKIVLITDSEPNCHRPPLCQVIDEIQDQIKGTENEGNLFEEIQIYALGVKRGKLTHNKMVQAYECLNRITPRITIDFPNLKTPDWDSVNITFTIIINIIISLVIVTLLTGFWFWLVLRANQDSIILLLNASNSMADEQGVFDFDEVVRDLHFNNVPKSFDRKIDIAKSLLANQILSKEFQNKKIGLIVFGGECETIREDFYIKPKRGNHSLILKKLIDVRPYGSAPLSYALSVAMDLTRNQPVNFITRCSRMLGIKSTSHILLVTDGYENCKEPDEPKKILFEKSQSGEINFVIYIIVHPGKEEEAKALERELASSDQVRLFKFQQKDTYAEVAKVISTSFGQKDKGKLTRKGKFKVVKPKTESSIKAWSVFERNRLPVGTPALSVQSTQESELWKEYSLVVGEYDIYFVESNELQTPQNLRSSCRKVQFEIKRGKTVPVKLE